MIMKLEEVDQSDFDKEKMHLDQRVSRRETTLLEET
jgi:hypothetical protein